MKLLKSLSISFYLFLFLFGFVSINVVSAVSYTAVGPTTGGLTIKGAHSGSLSDPFQVGDTITASGTAYCNSPSCYQSAINAYIKRADNQYNGAPLVKDLYSTVNTNGFNQNTVPVGTYRKNYFDLHGEASFTVPSIPGNYAMLIQAMNNGDTSSASIPFTVVSPTCSNGGTNYPTCTPPTCSNGGTNYPTCTPPTCSNGALDYPTCTPVGGGSLRSASASVIVYVVTSTGTLTASDCPIPIGSSSCNSTVTWKVTIPIVGAATEVSTSDQWIGGGISGTKTSNVAHGFTKFTLYHSGIELKNATATASCISGAIWNGSICVATAPAPSYPNCTSTSNNCKSNEACKGNICVKNSGTSCSSINDCEQMGEDCVGGICIYPGFASFDFYINTLGKTSATIFKGKSATLHWATEYSGNGYDCSISDSESNVVDVETEGIRPVSPIKTTTYTLTCQPVFSDSSPRIQTVTVKVIDPIIIEN